MSEVESAPEETTRDTLFGGRLILTQFRRGHRAGTDAVLLAAAAAVAPDEHIVDIGAGTGVVGLALVLRHPSATGVLVECDCATADLAAANITLNGVSDRVAVSRTDLFDEEACRAAGLIGSASLVVTNPPFFRAVRVRASPDLRRAAAHVLPDVRGIAGVSAWVQRAARLLRPKGRLLMIVPPDAMGDVLSALPRQLGGVIIKGVHPRDGEPAIRVLVGARSGSKAALTLLPPLTLHQASGAFTAEAATLHEGASLPFWPQKSRPEGRLGCGA